ncbi:MAG: hypothetical protein L3J56_04650 [Bacteroidales bacterium]|nr:hypothetical protein [Bacteroidales bacterium]
MEQKDFFIKEAGIISKELETKIEKSKLYAEKKRKELEAEIKKMEEKKVNFNADLEKLKEVQDDKFESEMNAFKEKYQTDNIIDTLDKKFTEFAEKTKGFLSNMGDKVSDFYHKQVDKKDKPENL